MAAVTAASAELLIIGWYIFRVLLQCAPARPGTKTQGFGGSPLRTITTNAVFRYSLQKLAHTVSRRTGRQVLGERRQQAPN
ncbi:Neuronatin [Microtus ochrogaster]|uniref:Neuronatin n=1 Tax=Microtus ochrogaster TaxID=79684 RepID=A0A8J6GR82_MICOH|nr:Neuronatin [Microtus ochrogaster]